MKKHEDSKRAKMGGGGGGKGGGNKKIDYKAKAIKGQKDALDKQTSLAESGGPNRMASKYENFFKDIKYIQKENWLPCITFFFSKAQVESLAQEVYDKMNFASPMDKARIKSFVKKAL